MKFFKCKLLRGGQKADEKDMFLKNMFNFFSTKEKKALVWETKNFERL